MTKFIRDAFIVLRLSFREGRRDMALAFVFPLVPPLFFAVLISVTFKAVVERGGFPTAHYIAWVAPGAVLLPAVIGAGFTATSTVLDAQSGFLDRLRLLPVRPGSVLLGRLAFDLVRIVPATIVVFVSTLALGAHVGSGFWGALAVVALTLSLALAWNGIFYVASLRSMNPQTAMALQPLFLPFMFLSTIFVPKEDLPHWARLVADLNPISRLADAARGFMTAPFDGGRLLVAMSFIALIVTVTQAMTLRLLGNLNSAQ